MEFLLTYLPTIFCYLSGILIAWSGFVLFNFIHILRYAKKCGRTFRKGDLIQTGVIGSVGVGLAIALFVVPTQSAQVMDLLLVLDCWYLAFLISVTGTSTKSNLAIRNAEKLVDVPVLTVIESASKTKVV